MLEKSKIIVCICIFESVMEDETFDSMQRLICMFYMGGYFRVFIVEKNSI